MAKHKGGRPTVFTPDVLHKLESAFSMGCSDKEACLLADISMTALYKYQEKRPAFTERKALLKEKPTLKARGTVLQALGIAEHAEWYLERKAKHEFSTRSDVSLTGADGGPLKIEIISYKE